MTLDVIVAAAGTAAALAVAAWPKAKTLLKALAWPVKPVAPQATGVSFQAAIAALSSVRGRLVATGCLDSEGVEKAIETLTLALVKGSDQ